MPSPGTAPSLDPNTDACPQCGGTLSRLPTVDGAGFLLVCDQCDFQQILQRPVEDLSDQGASGRGDGTARFRRLLAEDAASDGTGEWPDELLDALPPDARKALEAGRAASEEPPSEEVVSGRIKRTLMDYGFAVDEDARGLRLRSPGGVRRPGTGDLSAHDVVRLASDLGGAPPPPEQRRTCPACKAVVSRTATRCSWCDAELPPADADSGT